mmetsp:Transcript_16692/g.21890  ORF Transcript_16692/g.21890 Transcript_16692/m.21890 type:complete len:273 (-) Transcript_16692:1307-2125(-)
MQGSKGSASLNHLSTFKVWKCEPLLRAPYKDEASKLLKRIADQVEPILRARRWTVKIFKEMCPKNKSLLGLNVNRGSKIMIRLRNDSKSSNFKCYDELMDTMLHELCHIKVGPHSAKFYALWDELRKDYAVLVSKNITGKSDILLPAFSGNGNKLGGRNIRNSQLSKSKVRDLASQAAEKRLKLYSKPRSTASNPSRNSKKPTPAELRELVKAAAEKRRRQKYEEGGCANIVGNLDQIVDELESALEETDKSNTGEAPPLCIDLTNSDSEME